MKRVVIVGAAAVLLSGCGGTAKPHEDNLIALETRREALAAMNQASAQLGAALISNGNVSAAMRTYLHAVDTAVGVLPTKYIVNDHIVGLRANRTRVEAWCKPCAVTLERQTNALLRRP